MSHSFINSLHHCVFSTKERRPLITPELQSRLFQYLGGTARKNEIKLLAAGVEIGFSILKIANLA